MTTYRAAADRYERLQYRRAGRSGLDLPALSLGLWQKFGADYPFEKQREIVLHAFEGKAPFSDETLKQIARLKAVYGLELTAQDAHSMREDGDG